MYSQTDIEDAVAGGALSAEQASSFRSFIATRNGAPTADEEHFRLILGFNDLLCVTACFFALAVLAWVGSLIPMGGGGGMMPGLPISAPFAALFVGAASWGLAEIFTRKRRQWLTSILLLIGFTWGVALFLLLLFTSGGMMSPAGASPLVALSMLAGGGAAFLHWRRFRQPMAIATMYGFGCFAIIALMASSLGGMDTVMIVLTIAGVGAFLFAMWWDGKDPMRHTEKSEVGFWLHWLAALLIVNALSTLFGVNQGVSSVGGAIGVIVLYLVFALVGLAVNRRALVLTGISPLILALRTLISNEGSYRTYESYDRYGSDPSYGSYGSSYPGSYPSSGGSIEGTMLTMTIIGIILLLLAIYWAPLRRILVGVLPEGLRAKLPPTSMAPQEQATTFE